MLDIVLADATDPVLLAASVSDIEEEFVNASDNRAPLGRQFRTGLYFLTTTAVAPSASSRSATRCPVNTAATRLSAAI